MLVICLIPESDQILGIKDKFHRKYLLVLVLCGEVGIPAIKHNKVLVALCQYF